ncbi:MAG: hypothetical protein H5T68_06670 [Chloroflexi bacterium]|nr:hypothetical protein [Chloroflexota bacterium]
MPDANFAGLLPLLSPRVHRIAAAGWAAHNAGVLLTLVDGAEQRAHAYVDAQGKTWVLANFNLPVFQEGQVEFQPQFNTPDFGFLMGWVDNEGNRLYHIPLQPGVEGKAPVVYQKDNRLYEGLVDLATGKIDPASEKPYWQEMPPQAVKAVMAKYENAVWVTFWDRDGKQLEAERIKVCDLPPEPTPTPERPTPSAEAPELSEWGLKWDAGRKAYVTVDNRYGLPAGSEAGIYAREKYFVNGEERWGWIGLKPAVIERLLEEAKQRGELKIDLSFDPRGMTVQIGEERFSHKPTLKFVGLKGLRAGTIFRAPLAGTVFFIKDVFLPDETKYSFALIRSGEVNRFFGLPHDSMEVLIPNLAYGEEKEVLFGEALFRLKDEKTITDWFPGGFQVIISMDDREGIVSVNVNDILNKGGKLVFPLP